MFLAVASSLCKYVICINNNKNTKQSNKPTVVLLSMEKLFCAGKKYWNDD